MPVTIDLPTPGGGVKRYTLREPLADPRPLEPFRSRVLFAAAHVVADPNAENGEGRPATLDWEATLAYRRHLWSFGLGVAEAMDTAQRGFGLDYAATRELIRRSVADARAAFGADAARRIVCGAGTDQLSDEGHPLTLDDVIRAYEEQVAFIEECGGRVVLMASRALAKIARGPEAYAAVYGRILEQVSEPVILHWLGEMFDPQLRGYWGAEDDAQAMENLLGIIDAHRAKVDGVKMSLLDAGKEVAMRRRLPPGVKLYSGDDFHYPELIRGDEHGYSHGLLGILGAIAPAIATAMQALDAGDGDAFEAILAPTVPLSRHIFAAPTFYYKTGLVFLAYLNGHQQEFTMVGGLERKRSPEHLLTLFELADRAGLLCDPEGAVDRLQRLLRRWGLAA